MNENTRCPSFCDQLAAAGGYVFEHAGHRGADGYEALRGHQSIDRRLAQFIRFLVHEVVADAPGFDRAERADSDMQRHETVRQRGYEFGREMKARGGRGNRAGSVGTSKDGLISFFIRYFFEGDLRKAVIPVIEEQGKTRVVMNVKAIANFSSQLFASNVAISVPVPPNTANCRISVGIGRAKYEPEKFNWIGRTGSAANPVMVWHTQPHKTYKDALDKEITLSATGALPDAAVIGNICGITIAAP